MDVDIDISNRRQLLDIISNIPASMKDGRKHNSGVYFQPVPMNPITGISTIDYVDAEERGYFKIDILNVSAYDGIQDEEHLVRLMNKEPTWELLLDEKFVDHLFHLNGHADILKKTCPNSVVQLAAVLALIRPAKRYLIGKDWTTIMKEIWVSTDDSYSFKKSHAISYAHLIVVQMNLLEELSSQSELSFS